MPVEAACPSCEGKFRLPDAAAGKRIKCPKCKGPLDVPPLGAAPAEATAAVPAAPAEGLKDAWRAAPPAATVPESARQEAPKPTPTPIKPSPAVADAPTKAAAVSTPATKPKPSEFKLPETKAEKPKTPAPKTEPKPVEKKPVESKTIEPKPVESQPIEPKPAPKPAAPPAEQWFLRGEDGETFGPVDRPTLDAWHLEGRMTADSQLLKQGTDQWQWASDLYPDLEEPANEPGTSPASSAASTGSSIHRDEVETPAGSRSAARSSRSQQRVASSDNEDELNEPGERLSPHSKPVAFLLALTLGMFGIHRFYLGYVGIGLAMFFTFGGLLMWSLTDALRILFGHVPDSEGLRLRD
jgi:hypothetical protein